jgi:hypothetical protein
MKRTFATAIGIFSALSCPQCSSMIVCQIPATCHPFSREERLEQFGSFSLEKPGL